MKLLSFALALLGLPAATAFAASTVDVTKAGVVGDGTTLNTVAIQQAIDACSAGGGGTVTFPAGRYLTGTIQLKDRVIAPLAVGRANVAGKIANVELLGFASKIDWKHDANGLTARLPAQKPCEHAYVLKISGLATA